MKRLFERLLVHGGPAGVARQFTRGRSLVLGYHNIVPEGERLVGERSLHLPEQEFVEQLEIIRGSARVVPLSELLLPSADSLEPRIAITFDDAYTGAVTAGVAALARAGLPATIFVAPAYVGGRTFWWDSLAPPDGHLADSIRVRLLDELAGEDVRIREWAVAEALDLDDELPPHARAATEAQLGAAAAIPGISFGSHTWSHPNLARVADDRLREELQRPIQWLRERYPRATTPWLAYPYGLETPQVRAMAAHLGYSGAVRITGGWNRGGMEPHALPRLNVPGGISREGFALRVSGLFA